MEAVLFYFGKVILCSGVLFLYYQLLLKDKTFHHYNRFYLLGAVVVSLLLPLLKVSYFTIEVNPKVYSLVNTLNSGTPGADKEVFSYHSVIAIVWGLVTVILTGRFFLGIFKILGFRSRFPKEAFEGIHFYQTDLDAAPFSYFKNLFWKNSIQIDSGLGRQILKHEMVHIEQKHTYDKILVEIVKSAFWFNPFFYLIKNEIHLIHEYLADHKAVRQSDTKAFAQMLLANHFSGDRLATASPLLSSNLKKRLNMLKTPQTKFSYTRRALALPLLFILLFAYLIETKNNELKAATIAATPYVSAIPKDAVVDTPGLLRETRATELQQPTHIHKENEPAKSEEFLTSEQTFLNTRIELSEKEAERIKREAANAEIEARKAQAEGDIIRKQAELAKKEAEGITKEAAAIKIEAMKAKAEADIVRRDAELTKKEFERITEEAAAMKIEAMKAKAEADIVRRQVELNEKEFERIKKEAAAVKIEAMKAKAEADLARKQADSIN